MGVLLNYKNWKRLYETALSIDTPAVAGDRFAEILKSNYQVKEQPKGSNKGPEVSKYLSATGLGPGYPWCMAFVYSMFSDLSSALGISNPLPKTAGVLNHWSKADSSLKITIDAARKNPGLVKPGQIFIMSRPGKGTGHTGIVVSVDITNRSFKFYHVQTTLVTMTFFTIPLSSSSITFPNKINNIIISKLLRF